MPASSSKSATVLICAFTVWTSPSAARTTLTFVASNTTHAENNVTITAVRIEYPLFDFTASNGFNKFLIILPPHYPNNYRNQQFVSQNQIGYGNFTIPLQFPSIKYLL